MHRLSIFSFDTIRGFRPRIDVVFAVVVLLVVGVEIVLRRSVDGLPGGALMGYINEATPQGYYPPPHVFDRDCGYLYRPNHVGRFARTDFDAQLITNEHGFHGPSFSAQKPDDVFRVALLGGSQLAANHVAIEETWVYLLQRELEPVDGRRVELLNLGVDGYLPWNMARLLATRVSDYQPDVVVLWCDYQRLAIRDERYRLATRLGTILECRDPDLLMGQAPVADREAMSLRLLIPRELLVSRLLNHACAKVAPSNLRRIDGRSRELHEPIDLLTGMASLCHREGMSFAVFYWNHTPPPGKDLCERLDIPAWSDERVVRDFTPLRWEHDAHFSVSGNAEYARNVAPVFQEMLGRLADAGQ